MSQAAIRIQNLSKKYVIGHESRRNYLTFREAAAEGVKEFLRFRKKPAMELRDFWAVRDVSLDIEPGEVIGVIGRNGAGKSTFLKLLSRITPPTSGRIEFRGRVASLLEVGTGFHPELSGRENILLNGAILGMRQQEILKRFDEIVDFADIEDFLDTPVKRYSSGMYLRLAFAVAAHLEPDILLVDEVLAVGDAQFQRKCIGKMQQVARERARTVLFVSHNMQAVKALCTRTAHFQHGRVAAYGPTDRIVRDYLVAGSGTQGTWTPEGTPPGDEDLRLLSVSLNGSHGSSGVYSSSENLTVTLVFQLTRPLPALCAGFDLVTSDGATVFRSYQTDQSEEDWPVQAPGVCRWSCTIPGGLLNAGTYHISPRMSVHNVKWIVMLEAILQFDVILDHGVSPFWNSLSGNAKPGGIAPIFKWRTLTDPLSSGEGEPVLSDAGRTS